MNSWLSQKRYTTLPTQKKETFSTSAASSGLSEAEIQKMVREAAENEAADRTKREQVERRNKLDNLCYSVEKVLRDSKDKLQGNDVATLEAAVREGREAVDKQDDDLVTRATERLERESSRVAVAMQAGAGGAGAGGEAPQGAAAGAAKSRNVRGVRGNAGQSSSLGDRKSS